MSNQEFQKLKALYFSEIRKLRAELDVNWEYVHVREVKE